jgi:hypothetical protein
MSKLLVCHLLVAAVACALAPAAVASPSRFPAEGPAMDNAREIAIRHWGEAPCGGAFAVRWAELPRDHNALSTWFNPIDPFAAPRDNHDCLVEFNVHADLDWPKLCTTMVHEVGHLLGHGHDPRPGRLMSELYTTPVSGCSKRIDTTTTFRQRPVSRARTRMRARRLARGRAG